MIAATVRRRFQLLAVLHAMDAPDDEPELTPQEIESMRPRRRSDCIDGPRPCPWACRHNLAYDITPAGTIKLRPIGEWSCDLDAAERGGMTLAETGKALGITRERVRQIEVRALLKLRFGGRL